MIAGMTAIELKMLARRSDRVRLAAGLFAACFSVTLWLGSGVAQAGAISATQTFTKAGESTFVVPAGDSSLSVTATGTQGANGFTSCGGFGAVLKATLSVTPGETLYVEVGGVGANGGGSGGSGAGDGGGASDIRTLSAAKGLTSIKSRLLVAGGGGGGGDGTMFGTANCGGNAGLAPAGGGGSFGIGGGGPGGNASGGTPGSGDGDCSAAQAGGLGVGGAGGGSECHGGGGGGGGYYGGGGGGGADATIGAGGGAGSSFVSASATGTLISTASQANGSVSITYAVGPPTATVLAPATGGTYTQGQSVSTSFSCVEAEGGPGISSCADGTGHSGKAGTHEGSLDTTRLGANTYVVTATSSDGKRGTASITYTVIRPPRPTLSRLRVSPRSFRAARHGKTIIEHGSAGARISYRDSLPAQVTLAVYREPAKAACRAHGCRRPALVGEFTHTDRSRANTLRFSGRLRGRALRPGRYQIRVTAEFDGLSSRTLTAAFRVRA